MRSIVLATLVAGFLCSSHASAQNKTVSNLTVTHLDGTNAKLSKYLEKGPVYLAFWALWCEPCKLEIRALKDFAKNHEQEPYTILAVNLDSPKSTAKVKAYVRSQDIPFPVILDPNSQLIQAFNGQNLPFSVLLNKEGNTVATRTGYLPGDEKEIGEEILKLAGKQDTK